MIELVIFTPEADDDVAGSTIGMRAESLAWEKTIFARLRLASEAFSAIPRCIRPPSMSFGERRFAASHLRFSTS
jgi:hypothetical protein